jgi:hypothetical protein
VELKTCAIDGAGASEDEAPDALPQTSLSKFNCGQVVKEVSLVLFSITAIVARQPREVDNCINAFKQRRMPIEFEDTTHDELKKRMVKNRRHRVRVRTKGIEAPNTMTLLKNALAKNRAKVAGTTRDEDSQHYFPFTSASNQLEVIRKLLSSVVRFFL